MTDLINNRYRLEDELGSGGMGTVYRAYDRLTKSIVALKRVNLAAHAILHDSQASLTNAYISLTNEFRTLASLRHPNIISVLDYGFDAEQKPFFTMTLLEDKQDFLAATDDVSLAELVYLTNQILLALVYLHRRGIVHRDMKPANVLVSQRDVRLLDFGLSVSSTHHQERAGTLQYMSPETLASGTTLSSSDLYAVGVMLFQAITGQFPYNTADIMQRVEQAVSMDLMADHPLETVVKRLLQIQPQDRYQTAMDVIQAICYASDTPLPTETEAIVESFLQTAPFVGRDNEVQQLEQALQDAAQENSSLWLIGGESGVGKSRLVDELRIQALVNGTLVIRGQAIYEGGLPFEMWRPIVRRLLLSADVSDLLAGILKDLVPDIDALLERAIPDAPELTGQAYQQRLASALATLIEQQETALLLILEDLQWGDEALILLQHLMTVIESLPQLLIIATYRDDERPDLPNEFPSAHHLQLKRLSEASIIELSAAMLGEAGKQKDIVELLKRETEGNTFFMVEVVRALAEEAGTLSDIGRVTLPQQVFTGNMQDILQKRLEKLAEVHHPLLHFAAIAGRQINPELLQLAFPDTHVDAWLYACETLAILITQDNTWLFIHDKLREAILRDLAEDETQELHQKVAEAIELRYPDDAEYNDVLLEHWHLADHLDKEIDYLYAVAKRLIQITGEYAKAERLIQRALVKLSEDDSRRIQLLNYLAESRWESGNFDAAEENALQALTLAQQHDDAIGQAESQMMLGQTMRVRDNYEEALAYTQASLAIHQERDEQAGMAFALYALANIRSRMGDYQTAEKHFQESLTLFRALNHLRGMSICLEELGVVMRVKRNIEQALVYTRESLDLSLQLGDQRGIALKLNSLGRTLRDNREYKEAEEKLAESLTLLEKLNDNFGVAWSRYNLGLVVQTRSDYEYAHHLTAQSLQTYETLRDNYGIAICVGSLGFIKLATGDTDAAIADFTQTLKIGKQVNVPALALIGVVGLAIILHQGGEIKRVPNLLHLANAHPSTNTEVYFRLNTLPPALAAIHEQIDFDKLPQLDYESTIQSLLDEFATHD